MDFLTTIITSKRHRLDVAKRQVPFEEMRALAKQARVKARPHRLVEALRDKSRNNIIAEFKRRSPSRGEINYSADPAQMGRLYESAGAAAVSVLTEEDFFDGSLGDLRAIRQVISLPILRKDFVFEDYQVYEAAAAGADALLLIVAALDDEMLARLRRISEDDLEMDALVEVHTRAELDRALRTGAHIVGVNNRDLRTFSVSIETSAQLAREVPDDVILVSESGLNPKEVGTLSALGYRGFLVGEALMRAADPGKALRSFLFGPERDAPSSLVGS